MTTTKKPHLRRIKQKFMKLGGCSHLYFHILNREFEQPRVEEERATDILAGGIMQMGFRCGMLWGGAMAVGAESYRRYEDQNKAIASAILATQNIMKSFENRTKHHDCYDITSTDWKKKSSIAKYFFTGKAFYCFGLAKKWAPEAVQAAHEGLSHDVKELPDKCLSCASEVIKKMGGTDEHALMAAGLAGGMGLKGFGCGALAAAIWYRTLNLKSEDNKKMSISNPHADKIIEEFYKVSDYQIVCKEITKKEFRSLDEHTEFIQKGGCENIITVLAKV